ncbi:MAG TPA: serine hydrolase [Polyangiales bacterium]|nr:serine hydrolase [Polyangiales bacterium]
MTQVGVRRASGVVGGMRAFLLVLLMLGLASCAAEIATDEEIAEVDVDTEALTVTPGAAWVARHGLTSAQYQTEFNKWTGLGYRLTYISGYAQNNEARYAALFEKSSSPAWIAKHGLTSAQYQAEFNTQSANGYRLVLVNGYTVQGVDYFAAIWDKSAGGAWIARHNLSSAQYQTEFNTQSANGYRLVHVSGYGSASEKYAALWRKVSGPAWVARHGLTSAQYQAAFDGYAASGYHLSLVSGFPTSAGMRYAGIWEQGAVLPWQARHGLSAAQYQQTFEDLRYQGYRPVVVSGGTQFAAIWHNDRMKGADLNKIDSYVNGVMSSTSAPAISLAITQGGRLVFAKAYGRANVAANTPATTASLFRIASVSKPFTSTAIMRLVEQGKLSLDAKVFGAGRLLGTTYGTKPYSARVQKITVRHLLNHTAGGWGNSSNDPMFLDPSLTQEQVIDTTLDNLALTNEPGTKYAYSNFGYCLLGRIIEAVTGQSYASYVQQAVLTPSGISDMKIGGNTLAQRKANEVVYYGNAYGMNVTRMDSHGGWVATPIDLVRFGVRVDGFPAPSDVLTLASETTMRTGSSANPNYGFGWVISQHNNTDAPCSASSVTPCRIEWHNGSLPGTTSILVRTTGKFTWAAVTNTRDNSPNIDGMMWNIVNNVSSWPTYNLF